MRQFAPGDIRVQPIEYRRLGDPMIIRDSVTLRNSMGRFRVLFSADV
jgi:hypothetical protein